MSYSNTYSPIFGPGPDGYLCSQCGAYHKHFEMCPKQEEWLENFMKIFGFEKKENKMNSGLLPAKPHKQRGKSKVRETIMAIVLDESSSMQGARDTTISSFNEFMDQQKGLDIPAKLSVVKFSSNVHVMFDNDNLKDVPNMSRDLYNPHGTTALYDAIGKAIHTVQNELDKKKKAKKGMPKALVCIITDGQENVSREFNSNTIKELIESKQKSGNWTFVFLGANQDAILAAQKLSIPTGNSLNFSTNDMHGMIGQLSASNLAYRSGPGGQSVNYFHK